MTFRILGARAENICLLLFASCTTRRKVVCASLHSPTSLQTLLGLECTSSGVWRLLNIVHGGDPINMNGFVSRTSCLTRFRTSLFPMSHGFPVKGSSIVRSRLHAGRSLLFPCTPASCATRGCEDTSEMSASLALYSSGAPLIVSSIRMLSGC